MALARLFVACAQPAVSGGAHSRAQHSQTVHRASAAAGMQPVCAGSPRHALTQKHGATFPEPVKQLAHDGLRARTHTHTYTHTHSTHRTAVNASRRTPHAPHTGSQPAQATAPRARASPLRRAGSTQSRPPRAGAAAAASSPPCLGSSAAPARDRD